MSCGKTLASILLSAALGFGVFLSAAHADPPGAVPVKVGMVQAFFNDVPNYLVEIATEPFGELMKQATGFNGSLHTNDDAAEVARKLSNHQLHLGVFHGHEFAWAQKKYPKLRALMVAVNPYRDVRAFVVVHKTCPAKSLADLRGQKFDLPMGSKQHCRVYLDKQCADNAQSDPKSYFSEIVRSKSSILAMDDVCRGKAQATVVDAIALEFYKKVQGPIYAKNLKVLQQSEAFPPAVIVYQEGMLNQATLDRIRAGLLRAHMIDRDMMKMWNIEAFESVPANFTQSLAEAAKAYPIPEAWKISMR